jgi:hypothetical protein
MAFNYEDFRQVEGCRVETRAFLESDVGRLLIRVLRQKYIPCDVPAGSDALVSARILSQYHGAHACLDDLEKSTLAPGVEIPVESTFEAPESDHDRMPSEMRDRFTPEVRVPPFVMPEAHSEDSSKVTPLKEDNDA